jgi:hypothetical protein
MSDETRIMVGLAFISLPTIAFGGHFLLSILKRAAGLARDCWSTVSR